MVTHHRFAEIGGRRIFYREAGPAAAPAVVLLHGTPASSHQYRNLIPALADRYHVIAPDYPGFGHSDVPGVDEFKYTFDNLADHVEELLQQLGLQRYAIYVQDYGAPVGWRLALRHPERIAAIISQNGNAYVEGFVGDAMEPLFAYGRERSEANAAALRELISPDGLKWQFTHGVSDPSVVDPDAWVNAHSAVASSPERVAAQLELFADYSSNVGLYPSVHEYFRNSQVPLVAVWGRNDQIFGPDGALAFARDLPNAEINLLDGGHFLLESRLAEVVALIRPFLEEHLARVAIEPFRRVRTHLERRNGTHFGGQMPSAYRLLQIALAVFGALCLLLYPLAVVWPSGWAWHAGAPHQSDYFMMIVGLYATLGVFLLNAARNPQANLSLIWFAVWSSVVHAAIMAVQSFGGGHQIGHLAGDVPALLLVAVILAVLVLSSGLKHSGHSVERV